MGSMRFRFDGQPINESDTPSGVSLHSCNICYDIDTELCKNMATVAVCLPIQTSVRADFSSRECGCQHL